MNRPEGAYLYTWQGAIASDARITRNRIAVALLLARHARYSDRSRPVYPSNITVGREAGIARQTVSRHVRWLRANGYLHRVEWADYPDLVSDRRVQAYLLTLPEAAGRTPACVTLALH